jgi:redox-sensitive bicupin YhaK (pirin superfamily)
MKRKDFLKKAGLGLLGGVAATKLLAFDLSASDLSNSTFDSDNDRIGFNHLPNKTSVVMENMVVHKANSRGKADHGWLKSNHTFSFANYHNPERMHFGVLRVLNDDFVEGGKGFGTHPHSDMEIISIPLDGDLKHEDSMGNSGVIKQGDVQVMSAGTGIKHSEFNKNEDKPVKFLQIWLFPNKKDVKPRYDQMTFKAEDRKNKFQQILSPNEDDEGVWIHQDAWFHLVQFDKEEKTVYQLKKSGNGIYAFIIDGEATINGQSLGKRDGLGVWETTKLNIKATENAEILLMEVPMSLG